MNCFSLSLAKDLLQIYYPKIRNSLRVSKMPSRDEVFNIFNSTIGQGDLGGFFKHVDPNVDWTVKGSQILKIG